MPDNLNAEIEIESAEEKPLKNPFNNPNPVRGTTYNKEVLEWIDHNNKKSNIQNNQPGKNSV